MLTAASLYIVQLPIQYVIKKHGQELKARMPTQLYIMQLTMKEVAELSIIYLARVASTKV